MDATDESSKKPLEPKEQPDVIGQIHVSPLSITFSPPFNAKKNEQIMLTNPTDHLIGFKVKTSRPSLLKTRPAFGVLKGCQGNYVKVVLHPLPEHKAPPKKDHLTLVFAVVPEGQELTKPSQLWKGQGGPPATTCSIAVNVSYMQPPGKPPMAAEGEMPTGPVREAEAVKAAKGVKEVPEEEELSDETERTATEVEESTYSSEHSTATS